MTGAVRFRTTTASEKTALEGLTFPAFRHLLDLSPQPRFEDSSERLIQPLAVVADMDGMVVGMALAEIPIEGQGTPEILSLFVQPAVRRQGIADHMMGRVVQEIADRGFEAVNAVYMTGKPEIAALEKIFWKQGWLPPVVRMTVVRFTVDELDSIPWMRWARVRKGYEAVLWSDLGPEDLAALRASDDSEEWIPPDLKPWDHTRGFEPQTSMALKRNGLVVGWVLNHALSEDFVRYTCSFIRPDLRPPGLLVTLYRASLDRMRSTNFTIGTLTAPANHPQMVKFLKRHAAPYVSFVGETRGTRKILERSKLSGLEDSG
ncbi:MAG: hypothetical protein DRJ61_00075 [Acidobacteria bacterium]|nr:MAG: hypothetical protein DRJ65_06230 [Acidobacteriota bacterium]RLE36721.1 MAG: hypothetical protein DRJ61_00075 [Acidobacteriota bacterium]